MVEERFSFNVVEESLPTVTIAEYRRSRAPRRRRRAWSLRALMATWQRRA